MISVLVSFFIAMGVVGLSYFLYTKRTGKNFREFIDEILFEDDKIAELRDRIDLMEIEFSNLKKEIKELREKGKSDPDKTFEKILNFADSDTFTDNLKKKKTRTKRYLVRA